MRSRVLYSIRPFRNLVVNTSRVPHYRPFTLSSTLLKKQPKKYHEEIITDDGSIDFGSQIKELENKFKETIKQFGLKAAEVKQGKANTFKIGQMNITLSHDQNDVLKNLANVQMKNNNRLVVLTVFDPKHLKYIQSSVLQELSITPQLDARNPQQLNITLPNKTSDAKQELAKQIKHEYEHFRNSQSKHSLTYLREDLIRHIKKAGQNKQISENESQKHTQAIEKLFKKHAEDLLDSFKKLEKSVMQE